MVYMPIISAFGRLRQENQKFDASPGYLVRPCLMKEREGKEKGKGKKSKEKKVNKLHAIPFYLSECQY
jgi:hypothetical protein